MVKSVDASIEAVQRVMAELRPSLLDDLGLIPAIEWQTEQFQFRTGIECVLELPDLDLDLSVAASTALFRILQESLTNVARHANASRVRVDLVRNNGWLNLVVADNGKGISTLDLESSRSFGLVGMRERAHVFGGRLDIQREPKGGTSVRVRIPVPNTEAASSHV
jgi:signal transduction histidine kinase